jgi:hypothetical protein
MKLELEQSVVENSDYQSFSEVYPHIAESIKLERKIERLNNLLKSEKHKGAELKIKREITKTKSKLKKNNLNKRLHGEGKQEAIFHRKFKRERSRVRYSLMVKKFRTALGGPVRQAQKKLGETMHSNLPPSIFNLRELTVAEKGMALREWLQDKRTKL